MPVIFLNKFSHQAVEEILEGKPPELIAASHQFLQAAQEHADAVAASKLIPCMSAGLKNILGEGFANEKIEKALQEMQEMRREADKEIAAKDAALQAARAEFNEVSVQILLEQEDEDDRSKRADIDEHLYKLHGSDEKIDGAYFIKEPRLPDFLRDGLLKNFEGDLFAMEARQGHVAFRLAGKGKGGEEAGAEPEAGGQGNGQPRHPPVFADDYRDRNKASEFYTSVAAGLQSLSFEAAREDFKNRPREVAEAAGSVLEEAGRVAHIAAEAERFHGINLALVEILGAGYFDEPKAEKAKLVRGEQQEIEKARANSASNLRKARAAFKKAVDRAEAEEMTKELADINSVYFKRGDDGQAAAGGYFARAEDVERALRKYFQPDPVAEVLEVEIRPGRVGFRLTGKKKEGS